MAELRKPSSVIRFNPLNGQLERPTLLLTTRSNKVIGKLQYENLNLSFVGKGLNEISFDVHKSVNGKECEFWDKIKDLCIVDFKDFGLFEAHVTTDDSDETIKTFTCESLETELGQRKLYEFHVNTEEAITLTDGKFIPTVLCNFDDEEHSLLHRALKEKAPHWSVDEDNVSRLFNINGRVYNRESIQRTFTADGTSIYDFFEGDVSQECCCVFTYDTYYRKVGCHNLQECVYDKRTMEVLDNYYSIDGVEFYEIIHNDDGSRTERKLTDEEVSANYLEYLSGIGEDTSIFVSKNKLSRSFTINSDKDSIKNCFRVTGGDDVITNIVASANVSGNNYIYIFGNFQYEDMSDELVEKIKSYAEMIENAEKTFTTDGGVYILDTTCTYKDGVCYNENGIVLPTALNDGTNVYILDPLAYYKDEKAYDKDNELLSANEYIYKDTAGLYTQYCQLKDRISYVEHSKFPNTSHDTTAEKEKEKILDYFSSSNVVSRTRWSSDSYAHITGNIEDMITVVCDNRYEIKMLSGVDYPSSCTFLFDESTKEGSGTWKGFARITRETDETDTREFELTVNLRLAFDEGDLEFCRQKIEVAIAGMDIVNLDFQSFNTIGQGTLVTEDGVKTVNIYTDLADLLRQFNFTSVSSYAECFSGCRDVLDDLYSNLGITEENIELESDAIVISRERYTIRHNTALIIKQEIQKQLDELNSELETIDKKITEFRADLDMKEYFGNDLWLEFQSYIREDEYNNSNYISDGLSDSEIMATCKELLTVAKEELSSACNIQYQISGDLNNIFAIQDLKQLHDKFAIFNYIRCKTDDKIYKLRLMQIDFSDSSPETLDVTFSEQIERIDGKVSDQESIMNSMQSISGSYNATTKQAKQGATALNTFSTMREEGLNSSLYMVKNNRTTTSFGDTGIHCKSVLDSGIFSDCMLNVNSNGIYMTDDAWESVKTAIGKFKFNGQWVYGVNTELLMGKMIIGENLLISNKNKNGESSVQIDGDGITIKNGLIQSSNYNVEEKTGSMLNLEYGTFDFAGGNLTYLDNKLNIKGDIYADSLILGEDAYVEGKVIANDGKIGNWSINTAIYNGTDSATSTTTGTYIGTDAIRQYSSANTYIHIQNGILNCKGANISGTIYATDGEFTGDITATTLTATQSGKIANFNFNSNALYTTGASYGSSGSYFGSSGLSLGSNFKVDTSGNLTCSNINAKSGTFSGTVNATGGTFSGNITCSGTLNGGTVSGANLYTNVFHLYPYDSSTPPQILAYSDSKFSNFYSAIHFNPGNVEIDGGLYVGLNGVENVYASEVYSDACVMGMETCRPIDNGGAKCGDKSYRWAEIWSKTSLNTESDRNLKNSIRDMSEDERLTILFNNLKPSVYKFNSGTSNRDHFGFISQDIEDGLERANMTPFEFAGFCKDEKTKIEFDENGKEIEIPVLDENGNRQYSYSLRYEEFIALNTHMIQKTRKENEELRQTIQDQQIEIDTLKEQVSFLIQQYKTQEQN